MKVYIATRDYGVGEALILGAFSSLGLAKDCVDSDRSKSGAWYSERHTIEVWTMDGDTFHEVTYSRVGE